VFDHPGLGVFAASPEHLLAMKAFAARPRDAEDIRQLVRVLDLHTVDDVLASVREIFPEEEPRNASGSCLGASSPKRDNLPRRCFAGYSVLPLGGQIHDAKEELPCTRCWESPDRRYPTRNQRLTGERSACENAQ
jgi:hypothetical protein